MRCIEEAAVDRRLALLSLTAALGAALSACEQTPRAAPPAPSPPPAARPPAPPPAVPAAPPPAATAAPAPSASGRVELPAPAASRNWDDFKRQAARRLVAAHPGSTYMGKPPDMLFGIPVMETELYVDGTIKSIKVMRAPADDRAKDTIQLAMDAIRRAAPYGDMSRLPQPWKWVEVFLFNDKRQFKPRTLD